MKRLALILITISLIVIAYFQYRNYRRYNPPSPYDYPVDSSIDINYFDPQLVAQYYEYAYDLGSFARMKWAGEGIYFEGWVGIGAREHG